MRSLSTRRDFTQSLVPALLAAIMLGGLFLRLVFFSAAVPSGGLPYVVDEGNYVGIAGPLSEGLGFVDKWAWLRPPGYPAFLTFFLVVWHSLLVASFVQILLSVANIGLIYALVMELFDLRPGVPRGRAQATGLLAAGLMAVNPHAVFYATLFMPETLYMLALTVMAWLVLRGIRVWRTKESGSVSRKSLLLFVLAGVAAASAIYLRSLLLTFVPLLLAWLWWVLPRPQREERAGGATEAKSRSIFIPFKSRWSMRALLPPIVFLIAMFGAILPWTVRNYFEYNRFMLVDAIGGLNIWQYNDNLSRDDIIARLMQIPNPVDRDRYAGEQGVRAILANPTSFVTDATERFSDSWPVESFTELRVSLRDKYPGMDCIYLDVYAGLETVFYIAFGLLAIWGLALAPGSGFKGLFFLFLLHYAVTTMFAHAEFRYRMPLYPFATVYAGWAISNLQFRLSNLGLGRRRVPERAEATPANSKFKTQNSKLLPLAVSILFLLQSGIIAVPGVWKGVRFERRYLEGEGQMARGDYKGALASFLGAEAIDKGCSCLYRQIGLAYGKLGQSDAERTAYITALSREAYDWRSAALLSANLRAAGSPRASDPVRFTRPEYRSEQQAWAWDNLSPPLTSQLDVGGADIGYLKGFQALETEAASGGAVSYRWTIDHAFVRLAVPPGSGSLRLSVRWHSLALPGKADSNARVRVFVDGREAGTLTAHPGWETATLDMPTQAGTTRSVVIELFTPTTQAPLPDMRLLGVAIDSVGLESVK